MQASTKRWQCCINTSTGLASKRTSPLTSSSVMLAQFNALNSTQFLNSTFLACQAHLSMFISISPDLFRSGKLRPQPAKAAGVATTLSTTTAGSAYIGIVVDYFTKAAEILLLYDKQAATVARAFHDNWLMMHGYPTWLTSENGTEFGGLFRHQLERLGINHITTSTHHTQSNGAAERLVRTVKTILVAKIGNGHHDWPALLQQLRMEYMQRRHTVTGYSPNYLAYAHTLCLPPPIGQLAWTATTASAAAPLSSPAPPPVDLSPHTESRNDKVSELTAAVHD
jgi:transposase InsO family protein